MKAILSIPLTEKDIQFVNEDLCKGISQLQSIVNESSDDELGLFFSVDMNSHDGKEVEELDLIPGGRNRRVSSENVEEYSELMTKHYLYDNYRNSLY